MDREEIEALIEKLDKKAKANQHFADVVRPGIGGRAHSEAADVYGQAAAALRQLLDPWRGIEEYQEGMREVLISGGIYWSTEETYTTEYPFEDVVIGRPRWAGEWVRDDDSSMEWRHKPTHFMPLPSPPPQEPDNE